MRGTWKWELGPVPRLARARTSARSCRAQEAPTWPGRGARLPARSRTRHTSAAGRTRSDVLFRAAPRPPRSDRRRRGGSPGGNSSTTRLLCGVAFERGWLRDLGARGSMGDRSPRTTGCASAWRPRGRTSSGATQLRTLYRSGACRNGPRPCGATARSRKARLRSASRPGKPSRTSCGSRDRRRWAGDESGRAREACAGGRPSSRRASARGAWRSRTRSRPAPGDEATRAARATDDVESRNSVTRAATASRRRRRGPKKTAEPASGPRIQPRQLRRLQRDGRYPRPRRAPARETRPAQRARLPPPQSVWPMRCGRSRRSSAPWRLLAPHRSRSRPNDGPVGAAPSTAARPDGSTMPGGWRRRRAASLTCAKALRAGTTRSSLVGGREQRGRDRRSAAALPSSASVRVAPEERESASGPKGGGRGRDPGSCDDQGAATQRPAGPRRIRS